MTAKPVRRWAGTYGPAIAVVLAVPLLLVGRALLTPKVMAPLDALLRMEPWRSECVRDFPDFREVQTPLLDCVTQYHPWRVYARRTLRGGELPLWNPHAFCGTPFVANQQSAVFYPPNVVFWVLPLGLAYDLSAYLALLLAGGFAWGLARELGLSRCASALAVVGYLASGYIVVWLCYMGPVNSFIWAPLGMWMTARYRRLGDTLSLVGVAGAAALAILGGHGQAGLYALGLIVAYALFSAVSPHRLSGGQKQRRSALAPLAAVVVGLMVAMIQALPTAELSGLNYRVGQHPEPPRGLSVRALNLLLAPQAHGNVAWLNDDLGRAFGFHNYVETCGYVGLAVFWLALVALVAGAGRHRFFLAAAALVSLVLAVEGPHQHALRALFPPFRQMANVGRALCVYGLCMPLLGGIGLDALRALRWEEAAVRRRVAVAGVAAVVATAMALSVSWARILVVIEQAASYPSRLVAPICVSLVLAMAIAVLLAAATGAARMGWLRGRVSGCAFLAIALADAAIFCAGFEPAVDPRLLDLRPRTLEWLEERNTGDWRVLALGPPEGQFMAHVFPNLPTLAGLKDVQGYDSLYPFTAAALQRQVRPERPRGAFEGPRGDLLSRLSVRYVVTRLPREEIGPDNLIPTARPLVFENISAWPIAFAAPPGLTPSRPDEASPVTVTWRPNGRRMTGPPGYEAYLSETNYPGWRCYSGARPTAIARRPPNYAVVRLGDKGKADVVYEPGSYACGAFLSLLGLSVIAAMLGFQAGRRRR